jgi:hypothetical protein
MASITTITMNSNSNNINKNTSMSDTASSKSSSTSNKSLYKYNQDGGFLQQRQNSISNCLKFVPQAFNPNKCQQCFNIKDLHSTEALSEFTKVFNLNLKSSFIQLIIIYFLNFKLVQPESV